VWPRERFLELAPQFWRATRERLDPDELAAPLSVVDVPPPLETSVAESAPMPT
jgi:hypothetical protein